MASMQPNSQTTEATPHPSQLTQALMCISLMDASQPSAVTFGTKYNPLDISQLNHPENSLIVREALRMNLPRHLVLRSVHRRLQTVGSNYTDLKDLVTDLFEQHSGPSSLDQEVPMETNQLEEAMMMNSLVVKKVLRLGVPPHLLKPVLRAKILRSGAPYTDVQELFADVNKS